MARTYRSIPEPVYARKSNELVKEDGSVVSVDDLQEKLTFDTVPTTNSTNPVTSGGIKTYVDGLMSGALKRAIVEALPTEDIDTNTIYMVLDDTASSGNVYNEYLYISNAWELIGTTAVETPHLYRHSLKFIQTSGIVIEIYIDYYTNDSTPISQLPLGNYAVGGYYNNNIISYIQVTSENISIVGSGSLLGTISNSWTDTVTQIF